MTVQIQTLRQSELKSWKDEGANLVFKRKEINSWVVELFYAEDRGGSINLWEKKTSTLHHIWSPSDDDQYRKFDEIHFMHWENALQEYEHIETYDDIIDLAWRNS